MKNRSYYHFYCVVRFQMLIKISGGYSFHKMFLVVVSCQMHKRQQIDYTKGKSVSSLYLSFLSIKKLYSRLNTHKERLIFTSITLLCHKTYVLREQTVGRAFRKICSLACNKCEKLQFQLPRYRDKYFSMCISSWILIKFLE